MVWKSGEERMNIYETKDVGDGVDRQEISQEICGCCKRGPGDRVRWRQMIRCGDP